MIRNIVFFSSGAGSWAAAKLVAEREGTDGLVLLFADTGIEDEDNYRYLHEAAANVGGELVIVRDGRTPWDIFWKEKWVPNNLVAPCSRALKNKPCRAWVKQHDPDHQAVLHIGIDWTETHRLDSIVRNWKPWRVAAPLTEPPYLTKEQIIEWGKREGLEPPRLYAMGFAHANCGGFCVRGGQAHFRNLLRTMPERYAHHEQQEQALRAHLGKDQAILSETVKGEMRPLTLTALRERIEQQGQIDLYDWGACGCFIDDK